MFDIPGVYRADLAQWALANMYKSMRLAEQANASFTYNSEILVNSKVGDRAIPRPSEDLNAIANDNQMHVRNAHMYAAIFTAVELADDSPRVDKYKAAIKAVDAQWAKDLIPRQRSTPNK